MTLCRMMHTSSQTCLPEGQTRREIFFFVSGADSLKKDQKIQIRKDSKYAKNNFPSPHALHEAFANLYAYVNNSLPQLILFLIIWEIIKKIGIGGNWIAVILYYFSQCSFSKWWLQKWLTSNPIAKPRMTDSVISCIYFHQILEKNKIQSLRLRFCKDTMK